MPKRPVCEECDVEMHPYAAEEGDYFVEGWGCDQCGWSFDTSKTRTAKAREKVETVDYLARLKGKMVYLAGPYSDPFPQVIEQRMKELCKVDAKLMKAGVFTMTPLSKHFILNYEKLPGDWEYWQHYSRVMLARSDAVIVVMLPGWVASVGLTEEIRDARAAGLSIYYIDEQLMLLGEEHLPKPTPPPGRIITESGRVIG